MPIFSEDRDKQVQAILTWGSVSYIFGFITVMAHTARLGIPVIELIKPLYIWIGLPLTVVAFYIHKLWNLLRSRIKTLQEELAEIKSNTIESYREQNIELSKAISTLIKNYTYVSFPFPKKLNRISGRLIDRYIQLSKVDSLSSKFPNRIVKLSGKAILLLSYVVKGFDEIRGFFNYVIVLAMIPFGSFLYVYYAYPNIPQSFGGGKPAYVKLIIDAERIQPHPEEIAYLFPNNVKKEKMVRTRITRNLKLLYRTADRYYLQSSDKPIISLSKGTILGTIWLKEPTETAAKSVLNKKTKD